jgi:hypothetical protein
MQMPTPDDIIARLAADERALTERIARLFLLSGDAAVRQLDLFGSLFDGLPTPEQVGALVDSDLSAQMAAAIDDSATTSYSYGAADMSDELRLGLSFDLANPRAVAFLQNYGAQQVRLISETSRGEIGRLLVQAADEGWSYTRLARQIKTLHTDWSSTRAQTIAVTELGNAYQQAMLDTVRDAGSLGLTFEKSWSNTGDDRVSDQCRGDTAAGWIGLEAVFPSGNMRPLGHVRCRCAAQFRRKRG